MSFFTSHAERDHNLQEVLLVQKSRRLGIAESREKPPKSPQDERTPVKSRTENGRGIRYSKQAGLPSQGDARTARMEDLCQKK
jgi:hypothetical protein